MNFLDKLLKTVEVWFPSERQASINKGHDFEKNVQNLATSAILQSTQALRTHWSGVIISLLGFLMASNILLWAYCLTIFFTENNPIVLIITILLSSILIALWRLYVRYIDHRLAGLYPTFLYCEYSLALPVKFSTSYYLTREIPQLTGLLDENITSEKRIDAVSFLVDSKRIGYRGHQFFEIFAFFVIFVYFYILYQLTIQYYIEYSLKLFSLFFLALSFEILGFENYYYQKSPREKDIIAAKIAAKID